MLITIEKTLVRKNENGRLCLPDQGRQPRMIRTNAENGKSIELNMWIKACKNFPTCAKPGQPLRSPTNCAEDSSPTNGW